MSRINSNLSTVPSPLSEFSELPFTPVKLSIGWNPDPKDDSSYVFPVVHVFNKAGKRLDLVTPDRVGTSFLRARSTNPLNYEFELLVNKIPSFIDSIYVSLTKTDEVPVKMIGNLFLELEQGENKEVWGVPDLRLISGSLILGAFIRNTSKSWRFEFMDSSSKVSYEDLKRLLLKEELLSDLPIKKYSTKWTKIKDFLKSFI
jgi:hypothetical protein